VIWYMTWPVSTCVRPLFIFFWCGAWSLHVADSLFN
jgi:hypothetical protein